ncbi:MAG: HEAT repeat domain-containing protein [Elusimicrobia bacterium]|nr:HEAT repeat domain-containing protein [Elusimicrobiota bacterium]
MGRTLLYVYARARKIHLALFLLALALPCAGADIPALVEQLKSRRASERAAAAKALIEAGPSAVPDLVAGMAEVRYREFMVRVIGRMGARAVPALLELFHDAALKIPAANALARVIGPESGGQTAVLLECLREDEAIRLSCGTALMRAAGPKSAGLTPKLVSALADPAPEVRAFAAATLGQIGDSARAAVPALTRALADGEARVRVASATALGRMGRSAQPAAAALRRALEDADPDVVSSAREALRELNEP